MIGVFITFALAGLAVALAYIVQHEEREACAALADGSIKRGDPYAEGYGDAMRDIAAAIRARGVK